ncbi:hypothetical protein CDAR_57581 [Caerostris darwini]|uniref:Uncharacterized protein n=1 Tax=Caerostris darwini TaxID=1538125 RepID=A0AAV4SZG7_9ARAC|nr:hypothetical protein CDAR_57581 [Caerostris darwini]
MFQRCSNLRLEYLLSQFIHNFREVKVMQFNFKSIFRLICRCFFADVRRTFNMPPAVNTEPAVIIAIIQEKRKTPKGYQGLKSSPSIPKTQQRDFPARKLIMNILGIGRP